jgi:hypothetical protein
LTKWASETTPTARYSSLLLLRFSARISPGVPGTAAASVIISALSSGMIGENAAPGEPRQAPVLAMLLCLGCRAWLGCERSLRELSDPIEATQTL